MVKALILIVILSLGQNNSAPMVHDFGKVHKNQEVGHIFTIVNDSKGILFIEGIESG